MLWRVTQTQQAIDTLALALTPGLGPVLSTRLIERFGSPGAALGASPAQLERVPGIGPAKARQIAEGLMGARSRVDDELALAEQMGIDLLTREDERYPALLRELPGAPLVLYVRGALQTDDLDRFTVAIVGSRRCSAYGIEQAERFAGALAGAGLTVISGGARGIDSAAHRGAMRAGGRTVAVLGCGLGHIYPPENKDLFDRIADGNGAIVSELPISTSPRSENFPSRNRLISGLSLGTLVIEAGERSGALITAKYAGDDHGREVFALPGRVDSESSRGVHELLKMGGALLVTSPSDVIELLESPASREAARTRTTQTSPAPQARPERPMPTGDAASILEALAEPIGYDALAERTGFDAGKLRAEITKLELSGHVKRSGPTLYRV